MEEEGTGDDVFYVQRKFNGKGIKVSRPMIVYVLDSSTSILLDKGALDAAPNIT